MHKYFIKRLLLVVPMLLGISFIMFIIMHFAPGDPASIKYGLNPEVSESARANFSKMYDLDKPILIQYGLWMKKFCTFNFGTSLIDNQPVMTKILAHLPATILLQVVSLFIIFCIALPVGIISAVYRNSLFDRVTTIFVFVGYAMPTFWLALLLIFFFGFKLQWLPISGMSPWYTMYLDGFGKMKDLLLHLSLPVLATSFSGLAALSRYTRSSMIEAMGGSYVLAARARGIPKRHIITVHVLKNALLPIVTIMGLTLPGLISGSFIFETILAIIVL